MSILIVNTEGRLAMFAKEKWQKQAYTIYVISFFNSRCM